MFQASDKPTEPKSPDISDYDSDPNFTDDESSSDDNSSSSDSSSSGSSDDSSPDYHGEDSNSISFSSDDSSMGHSSRVTTTPSIYSNRMFAHSPSLSGDNSEYILLVMIGIVLFILNGMVSSTILIVIVFVVIGFYLFKKQLVSIHIPSLA